MSVEYWIYDKEWIKVGCKEYYDFEGDKIIVTGMGLGWALTMRLLRGCRCSV